MPHAATSGNARERGWGGVIGEEEDEEIPAGVLTRLEFIAENPKREQAQVSCAPQRFKEQREKGFVGIQ
jgi:hypothetical protein